MARDRFDDEYEERPWRSRRDDDRARDNDDEYGRRYDDDDDDDPPRRRPRDDYDDDFEHRPPPPKNYLVESILVLIFCCWPFAIPALVNASSVQGLWFSGRYREARRAAERAKMWCWISFGLALGGGILYIAAAVLVGVMAN